MIHTPAFRNSIHVQHVPNEGIFVFSESGQLILTGGTVEAVSKLIDGKRSSDEIAEQLAGTTRSEDVYYTLLQLQQNHLVVDAAEALDASQLPWHHLGVDLAHVRRSLSTLRVDVRSTPDIDGGPFREALEAFGVAVTTGPAEFTVVFAGDYLHPELAEINARALRDGTPWMLAKPTGTVAYVGPLFRPGTGPCWECLAQRLRNRRALELFVKALDHRDAAASPVIPFTATLSAAAHMAALHAAKWVALGQSEQVDGKLVSLDVVTLVSRTHVVVKLPHCAKCGDAPRRDVLPSPPRLANQPRTFSIDTGHRSLSAEDSFANFQHHISPIIGLVGDVVPVRDPSAEIVKLWIATHNFPISGTSLTFLKDSANTKSAGKGLTDAQARTSALLEALERYSGIYQGYEPTRRVSYRSLGTEAIHPNEVMLYSDLQYAARDAWNQRGSTFSLVPVPFDAHAEIDWSPVWSLGARAFRYLPTAYLYYGHPQADHTSYCWADSNGNAAGNTLEEAILQGFLELVERDAVAMWWYNRLSRPSVDLASFGDPYFARCTEFHADRGRTLWVLDLTNDFGIPTFAAISRRNAEPVEDIIMGFGSHLDARIALTRAITELNQFLPAVEAPPGPDGRRQYSYADPHAIRWWQTATVASDPYLLPNALLRPRSAHDYRMVDSGDHLVDLKACVDRAAELGMDTLVLDQTRPDVGIHVAKVIVPGIRHFWSRYAPGRLYYVPVKLGWLGAPLPEEQLNPTPMFL